MATTDKSNAVEAIQGRIEEGANAVAEGAKSAGGQLEKGMLGDAAGSFPSDTFLWLTLVSIGISATMKLLGRPKDANFVGEWAPTFLALGTYSKLTKIEKKLLGEN